MGRFEYIYNKQDQNIVSRILSKMIATHFSLLLLLPFLTEGLFWNLFNQQQPPSMFPVGRFPFIIKTFKTNSEKAS